MRPARSSGSTRSRPTSTRLLQKLCPDPWFQIDAPACVEATDFNQAGRKRVVLALANFQPELPNLPVLDLPIRLRTPGPMLHLYEIPSGRRLPHDDRDSEIRFTVPRLETFTLIGVDLA